MKQQPMHLWASRGRHVSIANRGRTLSVAALVLLSGLAPVAEELPGNRASRR